MFPLLLSCFVTFCTTRLDTSIYTRLHSGCQRKYVIKKNKKKQQFTLFKLNSLFVFFQGWMNETHNYDPETFLPSVTHSVCVTLDGSRLRLAYPRANVPRWAAFDETLHEAVFLQYRIYQLANSKVSKFTKKNGKKKTLSSVLGVCLSKRSKDKAKVTPHLIYQHPVSHLTRR